MGNAGSMRCGEIGVSLRGWGWRNRERKEKGRSSERSILEETGEKFCEVQR